MTRYTVVWHHDALDELAEIWLAANDRAAVTAAAQAIDQALSSDPESKGIEISEGLHAIFEPPLRALYAIEEVDRRAEVLRIKPVHQS